MTDNPNSMDNFLRLYKGTDLEKVALACLADSSFTLSNLSNPDVRGRLVSIVAYALICEPDETSCRALLSMGVSDSSNVVRSGAVVALSNNKNLEYASWIASGLIELIKSDGIDESVKRRAYGALIAQACLMRIRPPTQYDFDPLFIERLSVAIERGKGE